MTHLRSAFPGHSVAPSGSLRVRRTTRALRPKVTRRRECGSGARRRTIKAPARLPDGTAPPRVGAEGHEMKTVHKTDAQLRQDVIDEIERDRRFKPAEL